MHVGVKITVFVCNVHIRRIILNYFWKQSLPRRLSNVAITEHTHMNGMSNYTKPNFQIGSCQNKTMFNLVINNSDLQCCAFILFL